jgi:cell division protein ZapA
MAEVDVTINGRSYAMACDDGQEEHLAGLGAYVADRVRGLAESYGQVGDARLLVMASILIADELSDLREEIDELRSSLQDRLAASEASIADRLDALAGRLESVAAGLEGD